MTRIKFFFKIHIFSITQARVCRFGHNGKLWLAVVSWRELSVSSSGSRGRTMQSRGEQAGPVHAESFHGLVLSENQV